MTRVFVSGAGVVSPIGIGVEAFWDNLVAGRSGAGEIQRFDTSGMERHRACEVDNFRPRDFLTAAEARHAGRCSAFALAAAREAVKHSAIGASHLAGERTAVIVGTTMGEANILGELEDAWIHQGLEAVAAAKLPRYGTTLLPIHLARAFGTRGIVQTLPAACAAGNYAIGFAADQIPAGRVDVAITGATEILDKLEFAGFVRLGAVAPERVQPFDLNRRGLLLGEGAGMFVLESEEHLARRGGTPLVEIGGYGLACDAHHITRPHPDGAGSAHAMRRAIQSSGITPKQVDFINAHGTGTPANDPIEAKVIKAIFEDQRVPVTSNKSVFGHCMGAASAVEAVACIKTIETGIIPPTVNLENQDPACEIEVVTEVLETRVDVLLNNALAFGGYDAVLAMARVGVFPEKVGTL